MVPSGLANTYVHRTYQQILDAINDAVSGMTEEQLLFHREGKWSSAQVLEHLALTFGGTCKGFERVLAAKSNLGDQPSLKQQVRSFVVLDIGYFPRGRTSPKVVAPSGSWGGLQAVDTIRKNLMQMDELHRQCAEQIRQPGCVMNHPVLGPLKLEQWPKFHLVHTLHHMKQIRAVKQQQKAKAADS